MLVKDETITALLNCGPRSEKVLTTPLSEEIASLARYEIETQSDYFKDCENNAEEDALVLSLSDAIRAAVDSWFYQKSLGL